MNDEETRSASNHSSFRIQHSSFHLAESPLFWIVVFGLFALAALLIISRKHERRQERLVRMSDARDAVKLRAEGEDISHQPIGQDIEERTSIVPIAIVVGTIVIVAGTMLVIQRRKAWREFGVSRPHSGT